MELGDRRSLLDCERSDHAGSESDFGSESHGQWWTVWAPAQATSECDSDTAVSIWIAGGTTAARDKSRATVDAVQGQSWNSTAADHVRSRRLHEGGRCRGQSDRATDFREDGRDGLHLVSTKQPEHVQLQRHSVPA